MIYLRAGIYAEGPSDYHFLCRLLDRHLEALAAPLFPGNYEVADTVGIDAPKGEQSSRRADRIAAAIAENVDTCELFVIHMRCLVPAITWPLFVAACAAPPLPPSPVVELPPAPTASATPAPAPAPTAAEAAPSKDKPVPPEIMARLTAAQRQELEELGALCPTAVFVAGGALEVGCTCCPSNCTPTPDREPILAAPDAMRVTPQVRLRGAFTEKGADEHLVVMNSCTCAGCFDDAYVLRIDESGDLALRAHAGIRGAGGCKLLRRRGQVDRALCSRYWARMGAQATSLELYDFTTRGEEAGAELKASFSIDAVDDLQLRCAPDAPFVQRSRTHWELRDLDGDGEDDLIVGLEVSDGVVTPAMLARECNEGDAPRKGRKVELRWTAAPKGFKPTAQTAAELKRLDAAWKRAGH